MSFSEAWVSAIQRFCNHPMPKRVVISHALPRDLHLVTDRKSAAVLIPLCNRNGNASILFTKRSDNLRTHKGQVSFPGGHIDPDETPTEAAIRETYEELGSRIGKIKILGICQTIPAITGTLVTPIIGYLETDVGNFDHFQPSENEVSKVFTRTVEELNDPGFKGYEELGRRGSIETFRAPFFGSREDDCRIWGLTAMILDAVMLHVVNPTHECMQKPCKTENSS
jgi:nudix motif 8